MQFRSKKLFRFALLVLLLSIINWAGANTDTWFDNNDGTVTDVATGLIWEQRGDITERTHADAISYCLNLVLANNSDWRMPHIKELNSIVDFRNTNPALDSAFFLDIDDEFWSSTALSLAPNSGVFWTVSFTNGQLGISSSAPNAANLVRCVR